MPETKSLYTDKPITKTCKCGNEFETRRVDRELCMECFAVKAVQRGWLIRRRR